VNLHVFMDALECPWQDINILYLHLLQYMIVYNANAQVLLLYLLSGLELD